MVRKIDKIVRYGRISIDASKLREQIAERRSAIGMSLREVADKAGVSASTVHKLEKGDHRVQLDCFLQVLAVLDLLPENVFEIDGEAKAPPPTSIEKKIARWSATQDAPKLLENLAKLLRELPDE